MQNLTKINTKKITRDIVGPEAADIKNSGEPVFVLDDVKDVKTDSLVDIEILLRKGERVGLFTEPRYAKKHGGKRR